jgi:hypothetical protein
VDAGDCLHRWRVTVNTLKRQLLVGWVREKQLFTVKKKFAHYEISQRYEN